MLKTIKIKYILSVIIVLISLGLSGQSSFGKQKQSDTLKSKKNKPSITLYKIITQSNDTTFADTTLTIQKDYKFNYLLDDNFGLMPFANIGQPYNTLTYNFSNTDSNPLFGARARHFSYLEAEDTKYYEVPTPWTRLTYKTAFEQGQFLNSFFTVNLTKQFNLSLEYKGLRSIGKYQQAITSTRNFAFTTNYKTKDLRYNARAHLTTQILDNEENGGLTDEDVLNFISGQEEFLEREVFEPNFDNASNALVGRRYYFEHSYDVIKQQDSIQNNKLKLTNSIKYQEKHYEFIQTSTVPNFFGESFTNSIRERVTLQNLKASLGAIYQNNILGELGFHMSYNDLNYGYNSIVLFPNERIPNRIKTNYLSANANYSKQINRFQLNADLGINLSNEIEGNYINTTLGIQLTNDIALEGHLNISSKLPNYNFLLYQSDYINYNWYNFNDYETVNTQQIGASLRSKKFFNADFDITNIDNYTFFNLESTTTDSINVIRPSQYQKSIQYLRLKLQREIKVGNFGLDNTIMYQNVISDDDVLNIPTFITRNTLYYSNELFKKAMQLQTGVTFNYFTAYNADGYDPLLAEFYTQNETEIGGFPRFDFFVNAKIRQTRIFFKLEHLNSSFTGYDFFSAPNHPYRDFIIRFGLVWDFFL